MTRTRLAILSLILVLVMAAAGTWVALSLPADLRLPTHWNQYGRVDRTGSKWEALFVVPGVTGLISLILYFIPALEPRGKNLERSAGLYLTAWLGLLIVMAATEIALLGAALRWPVPVPTLIEASIGVLFLLIGNQLGKSRSMFLAGIRTPWTLSSEEVWIATHRLAGKLMAGTGLVLIVAAFLPLPDSVQGVLLVALPLASTLLPAAYSYVLWRREQSGGQRKA